MYHVLHFGQTALPADIDEARGDNDHADRPNDHQNHKELAVVTTGLARPGLAAGDTGEVLNADLR